MLLSSLLNRVSEVITRQQYSLPADIYSFGVILWEICEASAPFADLPPASIPIVVVTEKKRPPLSPQTPQVLAAQMIRANCRHSNTFAGMAHSIHFSATAEPDSTLLARRTLVATDRCRGSQHAGRVLPEAIDHCISKHRNDA